MVFLLKSGSCSPCSRCSRLLWMDSVQPCDSYMTRTFWRIAISTLTDFSSAALSHSIRYHPLQGFYYMPVSTVPTVIFFPTSSPPPQTFENVIHISYVMCYCLFFLSFSYIIIFCQILSTIYFKCPIVGKLSSYCFDFLVSIFFSPDLLSS